MAWSNSKAFAYYMLELGTNAHKLSTDSFKVALFKTGVTPTNEYAAATKTKTRYEGTTATWSSTNQSSGTGYTAGGKALATVAWTQATATLKFTAANLSWTTVTTTSYGALVYDTTSTITTKKTYGLCYNYFGGQFTSTAGTFTVAWSATGILSVAC